MNIDSGHEGRELEQAAGLDWEKIQSADRVTFLLNYLFIVLKNNEILACGSEEREIRLLRQLFTRTFEPYLQTLSDWISHGRLNDTREEFFIKENQNLHHKVTEIASSKAQWKHCFVFRSIDLSQFFLHGGRGSGVELSIPIFLRP
jgi:hypothetical protein